MDLRRIERLQYGCVGTSYTLVSREPPTALLTQARDVVAPLTQSGRYVGSILPQARMNRDTPRYRSRVELLPA